MDLYTYKKNCSGCTACVNVCPQNAIVMQKDSEGFLYPEIVWDKCMNCRLCQKVCGFKTPSEKYPLKFYAVKNKSTEIIHTSSSGGMFSAISDYILNLGGVVCGAAYNYEQHIVEHVFCRTREERDRLKGSKYLQSELHDSFAQIENCLKAGETVLFVGTPCQVSGLLNFLEQKRLDLTTLYTCDLVCHGVPSPKIWKDYITAIEKKQHIKVDYVTFKDKRNGWEHPVIIVKNGSREIQLDAIKRVLFGDVAMRPSCHNCKFTNLNRVGDITIGDFWGIRGKHPEFYDKNGVSLVLVNTGQGMELFQKIRNYIDICESNEAECEQPNLKSPTKMSDRRQIFWKDYENTQICKLINKYGCIFLADLLCLKVKKILKR